MTARTRVLARRLFPHVESVCLAIANAESDEWQEGISYARSVTDTLLEMENDDELESLLSLVDCELLSHPRLQEKIQEAAQTVSEHRRHTEAYIVAINGDPALTMKMLREQQVARQKSALYITQDQA